MEAPLQLFATLNLLIQETEPPVDDSSSLGSQSVYAPRFARRTRITLVSIRSAGAEHEKALNDTSEARPIWTLPCAPGHRAGDCLPPLPKASNEGTGAPASLGTGRPSISTFAFGSGDCTWARSFPPPSPSMKPPSARQGAQLVTVTRGREVREGGCSTRRPSFYPDACTQDPAGARSGTGCGAPRTPLAS